MQIFIVVNGLIFKIWYSHLVTPSVSHLDERAQVLLGTIRRSLLGVPLALVLVDDGNDFGFVLEYLNRIIFRLSHL